MLGKKVIRATDQAGFVVNALLVPYLLDAIRMLQNGIASKEDIFFTTTKVVSLITGTLFSEEMELAKEFFFNWGKFPLLCFEI